MIFNRKVLKHRFYAKDEYGRDTPIDETESYEWGWCINVSDKTVDVIKSSHEEGDTIVKTIDWIEGYSYEEMVEFFFRIRELKGCSFIEANLM